MVRIIDKFFNVGNNIFSNRKYRLSYVVEDSNWIIKRIGKKITDYLNELFLLKARITVSHLGITNQIIHFGSVNTFITKNGFRKFHKTNKIVLTWFHLSSNDKKIKYIPNFANAVSIIHTACHLTKKQLIKYGLKEDKIVVIPLGIDISLFGPVSFKKKQKIKEKFGIPLDKIIIGSFQKDGVGWGKGLEPKLIKGPDIFVKAIEQLKKNYPIFVLLVGPARGYIENELQKKNIPYQSIGYLRNFKDITKYYNVLDLYIIASRIEGGPEQILEAWASGVPLVSSKVGMVPDISTDEENVLLSEVGDNNEIADKVKIIIENKELRERLIKNGLETVQNYSWDKIAQRYYNEIYSKLL